MSPTGEPLKHEDRVMIHVPGSPVLRGEVLSLDPEGKDLYLVWLIAQKTAARVPSRMIECLPDEAPS